MKIFDDNHYAAACEDIRHKCSIYRQVGIHNLNDHGMAEWKAYTILAVALEDSGNDAHKFVQRITEDILILHRKGRSELWPQSKEMAIRILISYVRKNIGREAWAGNAVFADAGEEGAI